MPAQIAFDPAWDEVDTVRCSSTGEAANHYHDPATQFFEGEGGRSLASVASSVRGMRGVIVPRCTAFGGSRGFDSERPTLVNIDPHIPGQGCAVNLQELTKEQIDDAYVAAANNPALQSDIRLVGSQTYHSLACSNEPVRSGADLQRLQRSHVNRGTGYVVPPSGPDGRQLYDAELPSQQVGLRSPSVAPREPIKAPSLSKKAAATQKQQPRVHQAPLMEQSIEQLIESTHQPEQATIIREQPAPRRLLPTPPSTSITPPPRMAAPVPLPSRKVIFEMEGWGRFEAFYHEVIRSDELLILVYDVRLQGGIKYAPPVTEKLMAVNVEGSEEVFFVNSMGLKFNHGGFEYHLLLINQESRLDDNPVAGGF